MLQGLSIDLKGIHKGESIQLQRVVVMVFGQNKSFFLTLDAEVPALNWPSMRPRLKRQRPVTMPPLNVPDGLLLRSGPAWRQTRRT